MSFIRNFIEENLLDTESMVRNYLDPNGTRQEKHDGYLLKPSESKNSFFDLVYQKSDVISFFASSTSPDKCVAYLSANFKCFDNMYMHIDSDPGHKTLHKNPNEPFCHSHLMKNKNPLKNPDQISANEFNPQQISEKEFNCLIKAYKTREQQLRLCQNDKNCIISNQNENTLKNNRKKLLAQQNENLKLEREVKALIKNNPDKVAELKNNEIEKLYNIFEEKMNVAFASFSYSFLNTLLEKYFIPYLINHQRYVDIKAAMKFKKAIQQLDFYFKFPIEKFTINLALNLMIEMSSLMLNKMNFDKDQSNLFLNKLNSVMHGVSDLSNFLDLGTAYFGASAGSTLAWKIIHLLPKLKIEDNQPEALNNEPQDKFADVDTLRKRK